MLLLLRRIRYGLVEQGAVSRYLGYAIGEVILVVAGILIALQVDGWQREREDRALEREYLKEITVDLQTDRQRIGFWNSRFEGKVAGLTTAKEFYFGTLDETDSIKTLRDISFGAVVSRGQILADSPTYEDLTSTGNLRLFVDVELKRALIRYFVSKEFFKVYADSLRTDYAGYVNATYPWNSEDPDTIDPRDIEAAADRFRDPEFLELINRELTYAYSIDRSVAARESELDALLQLIEDRLAKLGAD